MRLCRRVMIRMLMAAGLMVTLCGQGIAQRLAVSGKTPANPKLVFSVPDSGGFWEGVNASTGGKAVVAYLEKQQFVSEETRQVLDKLSGQLGFSLAPGEMLTKTLRGLDFYLVEQGAGTGFVINARFVNYDIPNRILDQLVADAAGSRGVSGGVAADTVVDTRDKTGRVVSLPAFEIYVAAQGDVVTYSDSKTSLESALADEGRALFDSDYFARYMASLKQEPSVAWLFGEVADAIMAVQSASPEIRSANIEKYKDVVLGATLNAVDTHMKLTTFRHQESMLPSERRYALSAPPPGDIPILDRFSPKSAFIIGTNYFDGLALLDGVLESLDQAQGLPLNREQIDQQLQNTKMVLGFDLKNDLLSNLGPDLGIALAAPDAPGAMPSALLAAGIKDPVAFNGVLTKVQAVIQQMSVPLVLPPPVKTAEGQPTPSPSPTPAPVILTEMAQGEEVHYLVAPKVKASGLSPAWSLTRDSHFLLAADKSAVEDALSISKGETALVQNQDFQTATSFLDPLRNVILFLDMKPVIDILESQKALITSGMTGERQTQFEDVMQVLRAFRSAAVGTSYKSSGKRTEFVLAM